MPLTRRVQVYIDAEASNALDAITRGLACGQTKAIELALLAYADFLDTGVQHNGTPARPDEIPDTHLEWNRDRDAG